MIHRVTPEQKKALFKAACQAREQAHLLPGNVYKVGAAVLTQEGLIFSGCNIENFAHAPTVCAERVALFKAYSEGYKNIVAMVCVLPEGGTPCGVCRQVISDLAPEAELIFCDLDQSKEIVTSIDELLPYRWVNPTLPG